MSTGDTEEQITWKEKGDTAEKSSQNIGTKPMIMWKYMRENKTMAIDDNFGLERNTRFKIYVMTQ